MMKTLISIIVLSVTILACKTKLEKIEVNCSSLGELLSEIYESDQSLRQEADPANIDFDLMRKLDRINLGKVVSIIEQCGIPNSNMVGKQNIKAIFLVIQHANLKYQKEYFPKLEELANKGDLDKSLLAMLEDRILMGEGKPQLYGTQVELNFNTNISKLYKLEDAESVDKRRKQVGLGSLQEDLKQYDIEFNVKQIE